MYSYIVNTNKNTVTVLLSGNPRSFDLNSPIGTLVINAIKDNVPEKELLESIKGFRDVNKYVRQNTRLSVKDGSVFLDNKELPQCISERLIKFMNMDFRLIILLIFWIDFIRIQVITLLKNCLSF